MPFATKEDAQKAADQKNTEPLKDGQTQRNTYRVYEVISTKQARAFAIGQTPSAALHTVASDIGIVIEREDGEKLLPPEQYLAALSPERLEEVRKLLAK